MRFTKLLSIQIPPATAQTIHHHHHHIPNGLSLIQRHTNHRLIRQSKLLHAKFILSTVTLDNFLASKLSTCYSKTYNHFEAHNVFAEIPNKNTDHTPKLLRSFLSASSMSVKPDYYTVTCLLKALPSLGYYKSNFTKTVHCFIIRNRLDSNIFFVNALIIFYCRCKDMVTARSLFDHAPEKDLVSWNFMMAGYSQGGFYDECKEIYFQMLGLQDITPNEFTVISILQACEQSKDLDLGMKVHRFVIDYEIKKDLPVCNAFIRMYVNCGGIAMYYAQQLFEEMSEKDESSYGFMISGYMLHGFVEKAMDLFREMKKPGFITWNAMISGHFQNNQYEKPSMEHYECMIGELCRALKLYEAVELIKRMPFEPSEKVWDALFNGASVCGDVEIGRLAFDHLIEIDPINKERYGRWDETNDLREEMAGFGMGVCRNANLPIFSF
ncbi:unnamed protein product [Lactuca virosa]|uniref:Uncharacterized protein n=1 Tax=Lactuca virosa TaxID=75947 RepID=A0AAU9LSV0_9ASTR|nr:unnamed protein product [Lactuca virosa]